MFVVQTRAFGRSKRVTLPPLSCLCLPLPRLARKERDKPFGHHPRRFLRPPLETRPEQSALGLEPLAPQLEAEARRITARLLERQGVQSTAADWETVDVASVCDSDGRSVGVEHAALAALDMLGLPGLFDELGFNRRQRCCALANLIARMAHPGSERATHRWLRATSATGELLGLDFGSVSDMALYRASDRLLSHQRRIEEHVFGTAQTLFDLAPTITLYDLTNTFYEGQAAGQPKAQRGHSKEGRTDAPLLTRKRAKWAVVAERRSV